MKNVTVFAEKTNHYVVGKLQPMLDSIFDRNKVLLLQERDFSGTLTRGVYAEVMEAVEKVQVCIPPFLIVLCCSVEFLYTFLFCRMNFWKTSPTGQQTFQNTFARNTRLRFRYPWQKYKATSSVGGRGRVIVKKFRLDHVPVDKS